MSRLGSFWGERVRSSLDESSFVQVVTGDEGVHLRVEHSDGIAAVWLGPEEARLTAHDLSLAADRWEEE